MNEAKHTPEPWAIVEGHGGTRIEGHPTWPCRSYGREGVWDVATLDDLNSEHDDEVRANARLLAAAPLLAEKLKNCIAALTFVIDGTAESDPYITKLRATRDGAQAALSAALSLVTA